MTASGTTGTVRTAGATETASAVLSLLLILLELILVQDALDEIFLSLHPLLHLFSVAQARATALVLLHLLGHFLALFQKIVVKLLVLGICSGTGLLDTVCLHLCHFFRIHLPLGPLTWSLGECTRC